MAVRRFGHFQQGHGHVPGQVARRALQGGEGPVGVEPGARLAGKPGDVLRGEHAQFARLERAAGDHLLEQAGPDDSGIGLAVAYGQCNRLDRESDVFAATEIFLRIDARQDQFARRDLVAAESLVAGSQQMPALQVH